MGLTLHVWIAQRLAYGRKQLASVERLAEKCLDALGPVLIGNLVPSGDEEDRQLRAYSLCDGAELEPVHARHADVGDEQVDLGQALDEQ
jgi:hypothetical protein